MYITRLQKIFLFFMLGLVIFWLAIFFSGATNSFSNNLYSLLINIIPLCGGVFIMIGAKQWRGEKGLIHKGLFFMGLGLIFWSCGGLIWSYYNFFLHTEAPYPSLADLGYAPSVFFYCLGAIYLSRGAGADLGWQNKYAKHLIVIVPIIMFVFSYYILVHIARGGVLFTPHAPIIKTIIDLLYPLGDFISLTVSIVLSGLYFEFLVKKYKYGIITVLIGLAVMFIADFSFSYTTTRNIYFDGNITDLLFALGMFLLTFGSLFFLEPNGERQYESKLHLFKFLMYD